MTPSPEPSPLGRAIKAAREGAGISLRELGRRAVLDHASLSRVESGAARSR